MHTSTVPICGWGEPGAELIVSFGGQIKSTRVHADGRWRVTLDPMAASAEPRDLSIRAGNTVTIRDVLVGEVWLASGQSNMEYGLSGTWQRGVPEHKRGWSAVAYCFARDLRKQLSCPVAVIQSSWGGTGAATWMSIDTLRQEPPFADYVAEYEKALARHRELEKQPEISRRYAADIARWHSEIIPAYVAATRAYDAARAAGQDPGPPPQTAVPEPQNPAPRACPARRGGRARPRSRSTR